MQSRLYLHLSVLGTSGHLALLPCGIVVERSSFEASLLIAADTTRYGFPAIHLVLQSTVLKQSLDLRPSFPTSDVRHLRLADSELRSQGLVFPSSVFRLENLHHLLLVHFRPRTFGAFVVIPSPLSIGVHIVVFGRSDKKVGRVNANPVVAGMANKQSDRNQSLVVEHPRYAMGKMCVLLAAPQRELPVPAAESSFLPFPTSCISF